MGQSEASDLSYVEQTNRVDRQMRLWLDLLGSLVEPPPYDPARATAWKNGYEDALRDLAKLRAKGRVV
jgi:hypothetical protein